MVMMTAIAGTPELPKRRCCVLTTIVVALQAAASDTGQPAATIAEPSDDYISVGPVFVAGEGGYESFRIPGVVATDGGGTHCGNATVVVLVAEGRRYGCDDFDGQHDIVAKRSTDGGRHWGPLQVVADPAKEFNCTLGSLILPRCEFWDPTVLFDAESCEVLIMSAYASANSSTRGGGIQDIFVFRSSDAGATWSAPRNISTMLSATKGASYHVSTANGHGMQIRAPSPWAGRLIVPAYGVVSTFQGPGGPWGSSVYYSDNHGVSWNKSSDFSPGSAEGEVVQIPGHSDLYANLRNVHANTINGTYGCGDPSNGMCRITARSTCVGCRPFLALRRPCLTA
jgi:sialidase-1